MDPATSEPRRGIGAHYPACQRDSSTATSRNRFAVLASIGTLCALVYACAAPQRVLAPDALAAAAVRESTREVRRAVNRAERQQIPSQDEIDARLRLASELSREGEHDAAIAHLYFATRARPTFFSYRLAYANALRGRFDGAQRALRELEACIAIDDRIGPCWSARGDVLRELGRPTDAVESYQRALPLLNSDADVRAALAAAALEAGQPETAIEAILPLVETRRGQIAPSFTLLLLAARAFEANAQPDQAESYYRSASDAHNDAARGLVVLRDYYQRSGREQDARAVEIQRRRLTSARP